MSRRVLMTLVVAASLLVFGCPNKKSATATTDEPKTAEQPSEKEAPQKENDEAGAAAAADGEAKADTETNTDSTKDAEMNPALMDPSKATETAPDEYKVKFETTAGDFTVKVHRDWAPKGADRFYNLVKIGYFEDVAFFRVIDGFMAQFGLHGNPQVTGKWRDARIDDDPVKESNTRGKLTFATAGPNTRTTQLFLNFGNNATLDNQGFAPFGEVVDGGMEVVDKIHSGYGEGAPRGRGPAQGTIQQKGNEYLKQGFPELDYIKKATIVE